jgi:hypothetical protein
VYKNTIKIKKMFKNIIQNIKAKRPIIFENISQTEPISRLFGFDRGTPIDRYYIEKFLIEKKKDICGRLLEILRLLNSYEVNK